MKKMTKCEQKIKILTTNYRTRIEKLKTNITNGNFTPAELIVVRQNIVTYTNFISDIEYAMFYDIKKDAMIFPDGFFS